jgi:hypothetical protein
MNVSFLFGMVGSPVNGVCPSTRDTREGRRGEGETARGQVSSVPWRAYPRTLVTWVRAARRARGGRAEGNVYCVPDARIEGGWDGIQGQRVLRWQRQVDRL